MLSYAPVESLYPSVPAGKRKGYAYRTFGMGGSAVSSGR